MRNHPIRCLLILLIKKNYHFYKIFSKNCYFDQILNKKIKKCQKKLNKKHFKDKKINDTKKIRFGSFASHRLAIS
jgi:hypothetical protein